MAKWQSPRQAQNTVCKIGVVAVMRALTTFGLVLSYLALVGATSLTTYYHYFGIRLFDLDLSIHHIVFRGITLVIADPKLLALALALTATQLITFEGSKKTPLSVGPIVNSIIVLVVFFASFQLSLWVGERNAIADTKSTTSSLPKLVFVSPEIAAALKRAELTIEANSDIRVVSSSGRQLKLIQAAQLDFGNIKPRVIDILLGDRDAFVTTR